MNFDRMRALLLEQAVQGKLVPQLEDEPAVEQIGEAPKIEPFAIPKKWKWVRLNAVGKVIGGGTPKTGVSAYWNGDIPWITPADLGKNHDQIICSGAKLITQKGLDESAARLMPKGSIVYSSRAPIGHIAIAGNDLCTNQGCKSFVPESKCILTEWAYYMLIARTSDIQSRASGTTFKEISGKGMGETWIPLPPLLEQIRIVTKIEKSFTEIDCAEKAYRELQTLAGVLRGKILQDAVMGKLVPQLDGEPAVGQIGETPEIIPFEIPQKWKWVRLSAVGEIVGGGTPKTGVSEYWDGDISWITPTDLGKNSNQTIYSGAKLITQKGLDKSSAKLMPKGSIVYSSRAPIGHIAVAGKELCTNQGCKSFVPDTKFISTEWAYYMLIARTRNIQSRASGTTFKEISGKDMGETWISLPPLPEQRRIVAKVEELMTQVDKLAT